MRLFLAFMMLVVIGRAEPQVGSGAGFFDRFYLFVEGNRYFESSKHHQLPLSTEYLSGGILVQKKLTLNDGISISTSGTLKSSEHHNQQGQFDVAIRELYGEVALEHFSVRLGRQIRDLSMGRIYSFNDFLAPHISVIDPFDMSLKYTGLDGVTFTKALDRLGALGHLHIYQKDLFSGTSNDHPMHLVGQLNHANEFFVANAFLVSNHEEKLTLAADGSFRIFDDMNLYFEAQRKVHNDYLVGFDFGNKQASLAIERIIKNSPRASTQFIAQEGNATNPYRYSGVIDGDLIGGHYLAVFLRMPMSTQIFTAKMLQNMNDDSAQFILQSEFLVNKVAKTTVRYIRNLEQKTFGEFGLYDKHALKVNVSFSVFGDSP